ncbi:glycosyltransferase [Nocardioides coralli]|uniref:glycosyltransferase n=1 Tax=Nocardioides coralli TaxID=2872154 RepID=UPI001CA388BD|nr:glycosyltransferase [Nocardioides coralli]QZY29286.1 glycosyltransferase [Nocardioides coralli]
MTRGIDRINVVVPAHDEAVLLGRCLTHVRAAVDALGPQGPDVRVVVVLDACGDSSAAVAARAGVTVVECAARNVGVARAVGVEAAGAGADPAATWLATTDADSVVPRGWLLDHLAASLAHDVLVGGVRPDPADLPDEVLGAWLAAHTRVGHHVHGANLGVRLSAYRAVGGFRPIPTGEDVALVADLRSLGVAVAGGGHPVVTSGRVQGRAPDGFAGYLRTLVAAREPA